MTTTPKHPAIYARVSTTDQDCQAQLNGVREWLLRMGWPAGVEYVDHGFSGAKRSRPAFDELMKAGLSGAHDAVIVWKIDRFGRSVLNFCQNLDALQNANVRFVAASQGLDTDSSNPVSKLMLVILAAIAEFERQLILERSATGRALKIATGQPDSWVPSYGWGVKDGQPYVIPHEKDALNRIMRWRKQSESLPRIAQLLVQAGIKPKRSKIWRPNALVKILRNPTAIGEYRRSGRIYPMPFTLVDPKLFHEAQQASEAVRPQKQGRPATRAHFLLRRIAKHCDLAMRCEVRGHYRWYRCPRAQDQVGRKKTCDLLMIPAAPAEKAVWREFWSWLKTPGRFHQLALAMEMEQSKQAKPERDLAGELKAAQAEERRVLQMCREGMYPIEQAKKLQDDLRRKITKLELEIRALRKVVQIAPPLSLVERACQAFTEGPEPEGYEDQRAVLDVFQAHVQILNQREAVLTGKLPLPEIEETAGDSRRKNCAHKLSSVNSFFAPVPFEIKVRIAA